MLNINAVNYDIYRRWLARALHLVLPPELRGFADPMAAILKDETISKARATKAVAETITDLIAMTMGTPDANVQEIDQAFEADGLPTLTTLRRLLSRDVRRIFKAGAIANDEEYYMLKALDPGRDEATIVAIEKLLGEYESKSSPRE
jgi:hypothetical protein